jgi:predicted metal-dependent hydrolase
MITDILKVVLEDDYLDSQKKRLVQILFLTQEYLNKHNLRHVQVKFTKDKKALGKCSYEGHCIWLQINHCLDGEISQIEITILHEIAHALTPREGHGIEWQKKALELGLSYQDIKRYIYL